MIGLLNLTDFENRLAVEVGVGSYIYFMDIKISMEYISSRFENEPNEICNHLSEKGSKGRFFCARQACKSY